jgi:hypothetical protein
VVVASGPLIDFWEEALAHGPDEEHVRVHILAILDQASRASQDNDWAVFEQLLALLDYGFQYCQEEPLLTPYELGMMHMLLMLADNNCVRGNFDQALEDVAAVWQTLETGDKRRLEMGMAARRNSELKYICLGVVASCFAQEPALAEKSEFQPTSIVTLYWEIAQRLLSYLQKFPKSNQADTEIIVHSLGRWELEICKMCLVLDNDLFVPAVNAFNTRHGQHLSPALPIASPEDAAELGQSAWFWDFEVTKAILTNASKDYLIQCKANRLSVARLTFGAGPLKVLRRMWELGVH